MPIVTTRNDEQRRLTVTVSDPWSVEDIARFLDRQLTENTWKHGTVYDLRATKWVPAQPDVLWLVQQSDQQTARHGSRGPVAVIVAPTSQGRLLQLYAEYAGSQNRSRLRVFDDEVAALEWLASFDAGTPGK